MHANWTPEHPTAGRFLQLIGKSVLFVLRFKAVGEWPKSPKAVFIAAPHTSNWDLVYMLACAWTLRVQLSWMGKKTLFKGPRGWFMRKLGGVPVDRSKASNTVDQMAQIFKECDGMYLAIPPSGTRSKRDFWKSGFYHIARGADVPVICGHLDFSTRQGGIGPVITLTGDAKADMDQFRAFYGNIRGLYPEQESTILLKEE